MNKVNVFKEKDSIFKSVMFGLKIIFYSSVLAVAISMIFGCRFLRVQSSSMEPKYFIGDIVVVNTHAKYENLKIGDVITFKSGQTNVTHRIVDINQEGLVITQGDANSETDPWGPIKKDKLVGKVMFGVKGLGDFLQTITQPRNFTVLVICLILVLFVTIF